MSEHWEWLVLASGLMAAFWSKAKQVLQWIAGLVMVTRKTDTFTGTMLLSYLDSIGRSRSSQAAYGSCLTFVRPLERNSRVVYRALSGANQVFWCGARPMWTSGRSVDSSETNRGLTEFCCVFSFVRGTYDFEKLLLDASTWDDETARGEGNGSCTRFRVVYHMGAVRDLSGGSEAPQAERNQGGFLSLNSAMVPLRWTMDDVQGAPIVSTLEQLSLRPELTAVFDEMKFWKRSQRWYAERGIPWRRGCLFHGGPGTGKTSLARATAESLDLPIHVFDLATMANHDLRSAWRRMLNDTPCVVLLEDIDAVFRGRENVTPQNMTSGGLTFDCLLNCIDGVDRVDGMLLLVTTNNISSIDPALIDRPGRIDRVVKFEPLDHDGRLKIATRILGDHEAARQVASAGSDDSAAQFQERCFRQAIKERFEAA